MTRRGTLMSRSLRSGMPYRKLSEGPRPAGGVGASRSAPVRRMVTLLAVAAAFCYALGAALQHAVASVPATSPLGDAAGSGVDAPSRRDSAAPARSPLGDAGVGGVEGDGRGRHASPPAFVESVFDGKSAAAGSGEAWRAERRAGAAAFLAALARSPSWQAGNVLNAVGWALQAAALARGELSYVQPLLLLSAVMSLPLTAWLRGDRAGAREWGGALVLLAGVSAFLLGAAPHPSGDSGNATAWGWTFAGLGLACTVSLAMARGPRTATALAVAAGIIFGVAAALTKATVDTGLGFFSHWPVYALVVATSLGFYWMQRAYQSGPLAASFPVIIALDPLVSVLLGVLLFGERISGDVGHRVLALTGTVVTLVGIAILSKSRFIQPEPHPGHGIIADSVQ